jgi:DNA-binding MarR family transcriptional regulator
MKGSVIVANPESLRLDQQLCFALYAATHAITRSYRALLSDVGLTYPQYLVLLVLLQHEERTVSTLAAELKLNASTLTPVLKRLADAGLVRRTRDPSDERVVTVRLTERGAELREALRRIQDNIVCQTGLDEAGFRELRTTLHVLIDKLSEHHTHDLASAA